MSILKLAGKLRTRLDGWYNTTTGLGTSRDKQEYTQMHQPGRITDEYADMLYSEDDVAARICDTFPEYSLRKGVSVSVSPNKDAEDIQSELERVQQMNADIEDELDRLQAIPSFVDAAVWGNVFGAGFIHPIIDDGLELTEPLDPKKVKKVLNLQVYDKRYVYPFTWNVDPTSETYGQPETYMVTSPAIGHGGAFEMHASRLIRFGGVRTTVTRKINNNGFDDSLIQKCHEVLRQFGISWKVLSHVLQTAGQDVVKMEGYIDALAADETETIQDRLQLMDMQRSQVRALMLDAQEAFERHKPNWDGIAGPIDLLMYRLSLMSKVPVTIIMGRSPAGENATGEADWENFDSQVESYQTYKMKPPMIQLIELIFAASEGPFRGVEPDNWQLVFEPVRSVTPEQKAKIRLTNAQADNLYINSGVLLPDEVAIARYGPDSDSEIQIDIETRMNDDDAESVTDPRTDQENITSQNPATDRKEASIETGARENVRE